MTKTFSMKKIIVATDFSECAANAMEYALALAERTNSQLWVLHVVAPVGNLGNDADNISFIMEYYTAMEKDLNEWVKHYKDKPEYAHLKIKCSCENGFLTDALISHIEEELPDLLVMGMTGASGLATILGSNASAVAAQIPIPTLLIPLDFSFKLHPKIVFATDFVENSLASNATFLNTFLATLQVAEISVVSVLDENALNPSHKQELALLAPIPNIKPYFHYRHNMEIVQGIDDYIEENETDMICSIKHHHGFWYNLFNGSRTKELVNQARRMMLILHN